MNQPVIELKNPFEDMSISRWTLILPIVILFAFFVYSGLYSVPAESVGVVLRFGKYLKEVEPGLQFKIPYGVDTVTVVPVRRQLKQEFGFGTPDASNPTQTSDRNQWPLETTMVTGDLNSALVEWIIQYRINNSFEYLFKVRNAGDTLRDVSESVMREVVGDRSVDEVLTIGRQEIESASLARMQELVNKYEMDIGINQVQLKNVNPPREVQASFDEVNQAQQERERSINIANGEYNKSVPRARGTADQKISAAEGYATQRVNEAEGDVDRFNALLAEYNKAPEVTRRRLYLETMSSVLPTLKSKIIIDRDAQQVLPLLQLNELRGEGTR